MALTLSYRNNNTAGTSVSAVSGNNNGGVIGGVGYLGEKTALGFLSSVEGIWDYTAGGIAKLFGADQWAERQFVNNWVNYNHADEWYDPGKGWQIAGDVAGGIGTSLPAIGGVAAGVGIAALSGGTLSPVAAGIISASVAGLGAAGNATKQAYQKTGQLGLKEFGYGALSGATEAGIEALTAGLGTGTGRIVSSLSKRAAGETVSTLGKSGAFSLLKTLGADFASEAVEEGLAEVLDPVYQRWSKVDPEAKNATGKEIGYAALVGGLSGLVMSGGALTVNTTANLFSGEGAVSNGTAGSIINTARQISEYESANDTGYESFKRIREGYEQLSASLIGTGGQVSTVKQKMLLGSLKRAETAAFVEPFIERSAMALLTNADSAAERFSALGMTDAGGKAISFTADQIRSGVDASLLAKMQSGTLSDTDRKTLTRQLRAAIGTNSVLTSLAVMDATGRISMDTERFAQAALRGEQIADAADLNRFIETASPAQIEALSKAFKIDNWAALTPDVFRAKVADFNASADGQGYRAQMEFVKQAQTFADAQSKSLPRLFRSNTVAQGMTHYASADGRVNMALLRDGDRYHLYDYESGNVSREMTISELNSTMRPYWNAQSTAQTSQDAQKPMEVQTQGQTQENATQRQTAAQAVRLNIIAAENISDWNKLSEPNRAAVRMTMRQAIAAGMDEDAALTFGRVAARSGMNIVFSTEQSGEGDARISGNTIYIDPNADKGRMENKLLLHEAGHALMREDGGTQLIAKAFRTVAPDRSQQIAQRYQKFYQQMGMSMNQYLPIVDEEIAAAGIEDTLGDINAWEYILAEEPSFGEKLLNFFRKSAQDYSSSAGLSREARKLLNAYKKMFAELSERNRGNNAITLANDAKMSGEIDDARFSLKYADTIAYNQRITAQNRSFITMEELEKAIADTDRMVGVMKPHEKILPKDKEGKTLVKNGSYDVSVENTTVCIRTLSYNAFVDMVSEKIHRPLSQMESFLVSQKLYDIAKEPQCLYCYVSLDRKAYNEMLLRYISQRDEAIAAYQEAGMPEVTRTSKLYEDFRNKRKDTDEMWGRYRSWIDAAKNGEHLLTADDIATEQRREELAKGSGNEAAQVKDMLKYAQSASWAKKQTQYAAYFGDILRLSPRVVNNLNRHYGLSWYSFSDYSGAFIVENMQQITDASIRGLKGLSYTKDTDFAKIFAPTGMNINISVYAKRVGDHYEIDPKQSADLQEAIALRKKYPNVGIVAVATDQAGVEWALEQEWSDVVIPFHTVRTGAQVAEFYDWTVFNEEQNDSVRDENLWKAYVDDVAAGKSDSAKKKVSKMVYPSEHQNNREKYLKLIEERGLKPRFSSFLDNPNYMKLVNETRQSEAQTSPLKPIYDVKAAEESFSKFVEKGGYYEGWYNDGIDVDAEAEIVAQDIRSGKKANEVEYGRQDVDYEQIAKGRKSQRVHGERFALPEDISEDEKNSGIAVAEFIESVNNMMEEAKRSKRKKKIGLLSEDHAAIINNLMQTVIPDFSASGYELWIDGTGAHHIEVRHGKNGEADHTMASKEAKALIPWAAQNADSGEFIRNENGTIKKSDRYFNSDGSRAPEIKLKKITPQGVIFISECVPDSLKKRIWITSAYANKNGSKGQLLNLNPKDSSNLTPEASFDGNATKDRIAQNKLKVNSKSKKSSDERLALPEDGEKKKKYHMSHGQLRADVANKTRKKAYSKADARATLEGFTGADLLTKKAQNELADYLWQGFNTCETIDERQTFAKNFAQELGKRIYLVQDESPDAEMYRERVTYLGAGIGRLMISSGDYAGDFRHRLDKDGYKSFYARWSFGQNASKNGFTPYSVDKYVNDIAGEVPGMEYLREMHTADAMLEIDRLYTEAKAGAKAKVDLYTKDEIDALMGRFEEHIMKAFDERGRQSTFQKQVDKAIIDISQKADRSLRKMQKEVDEANQRYQDVLGDDKVVITKGQAQKQQAEFKSDRVYSRVDVSRAFEAIPVYNNIPSDVRRAFESEVWQGLNVRTTQNARELYLVDQVSNKLFQTILNEALTDEKMRELNDIEKQKRVAAKKLVGEERKARIKALNNQQNSILDDHAARFTNSLDQMEINRILDNAAKAIPTLLTAGKMSKKAAMEAEFDMSTAGYWKKEYEDAIERNKVLSRISVKAQKMKDLKMGTFSNATQMESDVFKGSIQKLASIEYRGNLSVKKAKSALREMAAWYTQEQKPLMYVDDQNPGYYNKGVAEMLRALTETDDPFTKDQLSVLQDVMSYFVKFVENYGKIWRGNKWIDAKTEAERYVAQITKNADLKTNTFDRVMRTRYINSFGDPHSVVKQQDRYEDGFSTEMFEDIRKAALDADVQLMNVMSDYDAFMEKNPKYMKQAAKQQIRWVEDGRTNTMPKMAAIGLYMTSKREHAQAGLALNGFKFKDADGNIVRAGAIIRNADPKEVTQAQIGEAISDLQSRIRKQLSAEDLEYIKILEKGYGYDLRALKAERDMARQGFTNVTTGYYYPIRRADIAKSIDTSVFSELDRVSNASFNKSIVEGARGKLFIEDADVLFHRHAVAVTRYSALSPVIESFNILFNMDTSGNPNNAVSVATMIEAQWPKAKEYFRDLIADVQGVSKNLGEYSDSLANLRSYVAMSQLGANLKTWVTQFSSLFAASSMLDTTSIMSGVSHASKDVDAYCDLAKLRNYESAAIKAQGVLDKVSSVGEALMKPIAWTDRLVVKILWGACQVQVQKDSKLKIGTEENKVAAGKLLTEVLFETQQNSLATERSAMMRSGNELIRALTMFSADGMKVTGRFLDGIGEVSALKRRLEKASAEERPALDKKLKSARKKARRATAAMVSSAVFAVAIAECFRWLYAKEREEDENEVLDMTLDFVGNLLGGLPGLRDVYTFFVDGYELDNYAISAVNDLLTSVKSSFSLAWDIVRGEGDTSEIPAKVKNLAYAAGQFTGLPVRNVYNVISGLTRRIAPQAGYKLDSVFYKKNYRTDLRKAVEEGDARRVSMLMGLISGKDITGQIGEEGMSELNRLALVGASVLPRTVSNTVSVNGEEVELDQTQVEALNEAYSESWGVTISSLLSSSAYASMSDSQKEKAIRKAHEISYEQALVSIGIDRGERSVLIASVLGSETAAVYYALTSGISSDVGKNGETVEGSRRAKVISAIRSMNLGRDKTLLLISLAGYSLQDGDIRGMKAKSEKVMLLQYIMKMPGYSSEQKAQLAKACGFDVKNGRVMMSSL